MEETLPKCARFGSFSLDLKAGELRSGSTAVLLQEQPFQVLRILVENEGALVSREEIRKRLWPNDTIVEFEHSINAAINKLRKALGDPVAEPQYIQTVARRGYRLMVPVEWEMPAGNESSSGEISSSDVVIPKGFPRSVGGVESRLLGFPCFPYSVISLASDLTGARWNLPFMAIAYRAKRSFELFKSISVLGKWPRNRLSEIDFQHPFIV